MVTAPMLADPPARGRRYDPPMGPLRRRLLGAYLEVRVVPVLLWSYTAITLGTAVAVRQGHALLPWAYLLAIAVGALLQGLVAHTVNEIVDWRSGTDRDPAPRVISGGSKVLASGLLTQRELLWLGAGAATVAAALGLAAAATRGWALLLFGLGGLAGAVFYTLPPVRAAYRPFVGEAVAFACLWGCVAGAAVLQARSLSGAAALAGAGYAGSCVAMLMMHHYLDRGPDSRALPPKVTSVVRLGGAARRYALAWAALPVVAFGVLAVWVDPRFAIGAAAFALALLAHATVDPTDPPSVTRAELLVILLGMAGGLGTAAALAPPLTWALLPPAILVPLELRLSGLAHRALFAERARLAAEGSPTSGSPA
jgi:1,4-dihydroxy-2-naphthoate octaprenyltransferase